MTLRLWHSCREEVPRRQGEARQDVSHRGCVLALVSCNHSNARTEGFPKNVRMANLAVIGSRKVNGVAEVCRSVS